MSLKDRSESGQAITLVALAIVVVLGFTALAIEGGQMYFNLRDAQNAADAASLAAALAVCEGGTQQEITQSGINLATANGFTDGISNTTVAINHPPGPNSPVEGNPQYVEVIISRAFTANLAQMVFSEPLEITVTATTQCPPSLLKEAEVALFASSTTCQDPIKVAQSSVVVNGGIVSNGDMNMSGSALFVNGEVYYDGNYQSDATLTPAANNPNLLTEPIEFPGIYNIKDYAPGGTVAITASNAGLYTYTAGNLQINTSATPQVLEGLYYTTGDFSIIGDNYTIGPSGITIVAEGSISFSATNMDINTYINGLLLFSNKTTNCGNNAISLNTSYTSLLGIIFAPNGGVKISAANSDVEVAIFAQTIDLQGSELTLTWYGQAANLLPRTITFAE